MHEYLTNCANRHLLSQYNSKDMILDAIIPWLTLITSDLLQCNNTASYLQLICTFLFESIFWFGRLIFCTVSLYHSFFLLFESAILARVKRLLNLEVYRINMGMGIELVWHGLDQTCLGKKSFGKGPSALLLTFSPTSALEERAKQWATWHS